MENAAKALQIAAGVLLAVMILSLVVYYFSTISSWPTNEDDLESVEQLRKFNLEFEVYDKSAMYGVDVISCLNKALNNNEKYVQDGSAGFLTGTKYGKEYVVNVYVSINKSLTENIAVYYFDDTNKEQSLYNSSNANATFNDLNLKDVLHGYYDDFKMDEYYTDYRETDKLYTNSKELSSSDKYMVPGGGTVSLNGKTYYSLQADDAPLMKLIEFSSMNPKISVTNSDSGTLKNWSKVIWTTALYDFKTKKFKCDQIEYHEQTGRINALYFSEI